MLTFTFVHAKAGHYYTNRGNSRAKLLESGVNGVDSGFQEPGLVGRCRKPDAHRLAAHRLNNAYLYPHYGQ